MNKKGMFDFRDPDNCIKLFAEIDRAKIGSHSVSTNLGRLSNYAVVIAKPSVYLFWHDGIKIRHRLLIEAVLNGPGHHEFEDIRINKKKQRVIVEISTHHTIVDGSRIKSIDRPYIVTVEVPLKLLSRKK